MRQQTLGVDHIRPWILDVIKGGIGGGLGGKFGVCTVGTVSVSGPIIQFTVGRAKRIIKL